MMFSMFSRSLYVGMMTRLSDTAVFFGFREYRLFGGEGLGSKVGECDDFLKKLSESQLKETLERLEKERDMIKIKFQSERHLITENVKSELQNENKLSNGKLMLFKKQNEFLETELKYYKKKVKDGEEDRRIMEDKIENYQGQLKIIMDCVNGLEEKFAVNESKLINDSNFEQLKHSINFNI